MFNGIIKNKGKINKIYKKNNNCILEILTKMKFSNKDIGSSISCSGVCLTLEKYNKNLVKFYLSKETLNKSVFKSSKKGDEVNLERPMKYGEPVSGHFVQGHVDTTSKIRKIISSGKSKIIEFTLSKKYKKYIVHKGSIAINGVSLTISKVFKDGFQIVVVPKTLKSTNLISLKKKDFVNIEFDILGKYINTFVK